MLPPRGFFGYIFIDSIFINFNKFDVITPKAAKSGQITLNKSHYIRGSRSFKVNTFGTSRKPVRDLCVCIAMYLALFPLYRVLGLYWPNVRYYHSNNTP